MRLRDEQKEQKVREKALELLVDLGFEGFSMQKLAKAAGVSPATLYIYFKDKEDLILQLGEEIGLIMTETTFKGFDPEMNLEEGLWVQWVNRSQYYLNNRIEVEFYDQLKLSPYREKLAAQITARFSEKMGQFLKKAIERGEIDKMKPEIFWSLAFAPLFTLIRFHLDKKSMGGKPYQISEEDLRVAFSYVIRGLRNKS
jgi:AcrR family transcriptional regulator